MKKLLYLLLAAPMLFAACNKDEIDTFDSEDAGIYFQYGGQRRLYINEDGYMDSLKFTFSESGDEVTDTTLYTRLRTLGKTRDYDRQVRVVVDTEHSTAVEGTHFRVDFSNLVIPAGKSEVQVPVTFLRSKDLLTNEVRLYLKVEDNEHFKVPFSRQKNTNVYYASGDTIMADRFLFVVNEFYSEPLLWSLFFTYSPNPCGTWSASKQRLMSRLFNLTSYDWSIDGWRNGDGKVQSSRFTYFAIKLRVYLQEQADAGTPVIDDDGSYMQLSSSYEVDYSNVL